MIPNNISSSWDDFLDTETLKIINTIEERIGNNYTPTKDKILRFLTNDLNNMRVCIVGQDVYYQPGISTGRAFEVSGLLRWDIPFRQVSLKNIIRLIHKSYKGIEEYEEIKKYSMIASEIKSDEFAILPPSDLFQSLEDQGVLFLNSYFTCELGKPNSHRHIWEEFSHKVFKYISDKKPDMYWFLWGNEAASKKKYITNGIIYESRHPMICSVKYPDDFLKSDCFKDTMNIINWLGKK